MISLGAWLKVPVQHLIVVIPTRFFSRSWLILDLYATIVYDASLTKQVLMHLARFEYLTSMTKPLPKSLLYFKALCPVTYYHQFTTRLTHNLKALKYFFINHEDRRFFYLKPS